jgi:hypothetical protein
VETNIKMHDHLKPRSKQPPPCTRQT